MAKLTFALLTMGASILLLVQVDDAGAYWTAKQADISTVPWHVALIVNGVYRCGGAIIDEQWILTAGHCTSHREKLPLTVRVGSSDSGTGGEIHKVEKAFTHPQYMTDTNNDIGLLKLSEPLKLGSTLKKLSLPPKDLPTPGHLTEVSWARRNKTDQDHLKIAKVTIQILDFQRCRNHFPEVHPNETVQLCGGSMSKKWCHADTGGSLSNGSVVMGVVSYGEEVCGYNPVVYTKVTAFRDWIRDTTGL